MLTFSRRRCCLCVFLEYREEQCGGQIAHISRDPSDSEFENLVFLCLKYHDEYDSRHTRSKSLMPEEVKDYRDRREAFFIEPPGGLEVRLR